MNCIKRFFKKIKNEGFKKALMLLYEMLLSRIFYFLLKLEDKIPLKNIIVFECESDMDDNPRAVYEYMIKEKMYRKYRFVWIVKNVDFCKKNYANKNTVFINRYDKTLKNQLVLNYYLSTAKWFIFSHPYWFIKKNKKQIVVHIGHGTPIKQAEKTFNSDCYDFLMVPSMNVLEWYTTFWHCDKSKSFICGLPRNDLLFIDECKKNNILKKLIPDISDEKVIMCMPTYRQSATKIDSNVEDTYSLSVVDTEEQFLQLNSVLAKLHIHLIVKIHPLQKLDNLKTGNVSNIHYIQNADLFYKKVLLYELLGCCDSLITDVSSVVFDFLLLDRPVAFFMNNYHLYSRGYILDNPVEFMPGDKIYQFENLITYLNVFSQTNANYSFKRKRICEFANGTHSPKTSFAQDFLNWFNNQKEE